jgi:hypothetical protein
LGTPTNQSHGHPESISLPGTELRLAADPVAVRVERHRDWYASHVEGCVFGVGTRSGVADRGRLTEAEALFQRDLKTAEEGEMRRHQATSAWGLGCVSAARGGTVSSIALHQRALAIRRDIEDRLGVIDSLVALAGVIVPEHPAEAAHLVGAATSLRQGTGTVATRRVDAEIAHVEASIEAAIGRLAMVQAEEEGARIGEQAALAAALDLAPGGGG